MSFTEIDRSAVKHTARHIPALRILYLVLYRIASKTKKNSQCRNRHCESAGINQELGVVFNKRHQIANGLDVFDISKSTTSRESAPKSSAIRVSAVMVSSSTSNCSLRIALTFSNTMIIPPSCKTCPRTIIRGYMKILFVFWHFVNILF